MKPIITFDKSAASFILQSLGKYLDKQGYIRGPSGVSNQRTLCGICKKPIHIKRFAGWVKSVGCVCNNISCLVSISGEVKKKKESC